MIITFNADEIFEMAEEIERNGAKFYRKAAANDGDKKIKQMLLDMAVMEDGHLRTFKEMREQLGPQEKSSDVFDPDDQAAQYLQTMADGRGFEGKVNIAEELTGKESIEEILTTAINAEKNSVVFYVGLKELVSVKAGRDKIERIIKEELSHITNLKQQLAAVRKKGS